MELLSILLVILSVFFGYYKPRNALWFAAITYPLLYPANLTIIPSESLFLNISRVTFSILVGVYLRKRGSLNFRGLFKYPFIKTYLLFAIYVIFISLDDRFLNLIVTYIPNLFISFGLGFFLIESGNDYKRFIKILALQAFVFSLLILLDYFHITNISLMMRQLSPGYNEELTQQNLVRAGIERVAGIDGDSINSAIRLVVLFPITLLFLINFTKKFYNYAIPAFIVLGIVLMMSRAAYISFVVMLLFLIYYTSIKIERNIVRKMALGFRISLIVTIFTLGLYVSIPLVSKVANNIYAYSFSNEASDDVSTRTDRIPYAFDQIMKKPFIGHGSPKHAYEDVMSTDDVPAFVLYALSGGLPLLFLFSIWWVIMPFSFFKFLSMPYISKPDKYIIVFTSASFVGGLIPMLANRNDKSLILMLIIFTATYKYLLVKKINYYRNIKNETPSSRYRSQINL